MPVHSSASGSGKRTKSIVFVALDHDGLRALGFTQLYPSFSSGLGRRIFILNDLFVDSGSAPQQRCAQLLSAAAGFGRESRAARLPTLFTALDNASAQAVYGIIKAAFGGETTCSAPTITAALISEGLSAAPFSRGSVRPRAGVVSGNWLDRAGLARTTGKRGCRRMSVAHRLV